APCFVENCAQWDSPATFMSWRGPILAQFEGDAVVLKKYAPTGIATIRLVFDGAEPTCTVVGEDELPGKCNFFLGKDAQRWRAGVSTFSRVVYRGLYQGIDVVFWWNNGVLNYDLRVSADADVHRCRIRCEGCGSLSIDPQGTLSCTTPEGGVLRQGQPLAT